MKAEELSDEELRERYIETKKRYEEQKADMVHSKMILLDLEAEVDRRCDKKKFTE
jgi:thermostable 8-oxoguanine DNA glycosylase